MKNCLTKVFSLLKSFYLFLALHIHVGVGLEDDERNRHDNENHDVVREHHDVDKKGE